MKAQIKLGRVAGIEIGLHYSRINVTEIRTYDRRKRLDDYAAIQGNAETDESAGMNQMSDVLQLVVNGNTKHDNTRYVVH